LKRWLINGRQGEFVSVDDRGLAYGDGLFETISVRGGELRFFSAHYERLAASCSRLQMPAPEQQYLLDCAAQLVADERHGTLKIIVTRGTGQRGYALPDTVKPTCAVGFSPEDPSSPLSQGITARICQTRVSSNPATAGMKTLNRLEQVMARAEWQDTDIGEGIMLSIQGEVVCGTMSNIFLVTDGRLVTPVLDQYGVHGIMRAQVMEVAKSLGLSCDEERIDADRLGEFGELFFTNSRIGVWPVARLKPHSYVRQEATVAIMRGLAERGVSECAC
jgi:4-amino-4-deoxychorismate lyase